MDNKGFQQYKDQAIHTMTQGELLLLLYDELVKRLLRAGMALEKENYQVFEASVDRSVEIIRYLDSTLDMKYEISGNLHKMYDFFCYELARVKFGRNQTELDRVRGMVGELRDSFREADRKNSSGK